MLCAKELIMIREAAIDKWDREKAESLARSIAASIKLCEDTIGPALEKMALNVTGMISTSVMFAISFDDYGNELLSRVRFDGKTYFDGTRSISPIEDEYYNKIAIEEYLQQHCLSVKWEDQMYYRYGFGENKAYELTIEVK